MNTLKKMRLFVLLMMINLMTSFGVKAGPFYPVCMAACLATCEGTAAVTLTPVGAAALTASCIAACTAACLPTCLSEQTSIVVYENEVSHLKNISDIKIGDLVRTFKNGKSIWTEVIRNIRSEGSFNFIQFTLRNLTHIITKPITVTPEHVMILRAENGESVLSSASRVQMGDQMISAYGPLSIVGLKPIQQASKYTLMTAEGTVLASDIFVSTICSEVVAGGEQLFEETMENWRNDHRALLKKQN